MTSLLINIECVIREGGQLAFIGVGGATPERNRVSAGQVRMVPAEMDAVRHNL